MRSGVRAYLDEDLVVEEADGVGLQKRRGDFAGRPLQGELLEVADSGGEAGVEQEAAVVLRNAIDQEGLSARLDVGHDAADVVLAAVGLRGTSRNLACSAAPANQAEVVTRWAFVHAGHRRVDGAS